MSEYLQRRVLTDRNDANDLVRTIRETAQLLLDDDERQCKSIRREYIAALASLTLKSLRRSWVLELLSSLHENELSQASDRNDLLTAAAYTGKITMVTNLLESGIDVNRRSEYFGYPLQAAAYQGKKDIVQLLLDHDSNTNIDRRPGHYSDYEYFVISSECQGTPFQAAAFGGDEDTVHLLMPPKFESITATSEYMKAIGEAGRGGHASLVKRMLEMGNIMNSSELHLIMLFRACISGYDSVARVILDTGVLINESDKENQTCLQYASLLGHEKVVQLLLERGADQTAGRPDKSPLHMAASRGFLRIAEILLENGAEINGGWPFRGCWLTPFAAAASFGQDHMLPFLLERGASLAGTEIGQRALICAIDSGYESTIGILAGYGVDINEEDKERADWDDADTPMLKAILTGHDHIVRKLTELGAPSIDPLKTRFAKQFRSGKLPYRGLLDAPTGYRGGFSSWSRASYWPAVSPFSA